LLENMQVAGNLFSMFGNETCYLVHKQALCLLSNAPTQGKEIQLNGEIGRNCCTIQYSNN